MRQTASHSKERNEHGAEVHNDTRTTLELCRGSRMKLDGHVSRFKMLGRYCVHASVFRFSMTGQFVFSC